jgi:hypothetical protein
MEKTGQLVKIKYDFNTASNLEIFMPNLNGWYRVTSREFRSFNGDRRINDVIYKGPVYLYNTNKKINKTKYEKHKLAGYKWESKKREYEKY